MKIALYGKTFTPGFHPHIQKLFTMLSDNKAEISIFASFLDFIDTQKIHKPVFESVYSSEKDLNPETDLLVSIGGDGTFLESIPLVFRNKIPIIGINSGRMGFLANISKEDIESAFSSIFNGDHQIELRTMIHFQTPEDIFGDLNFALNEITIQKNDASLINIDAYIDNEFLNTYWTDGLIVSTPTGSTAYSLSAGGPIVVPGAGSFIIAPIASHNLTVRPIVIPDHVHIKLSVNSRSGQYLITADNRTKLVDSSVHFNICKSEYTLHMIKLPSTNFYSTIRNKLMWGMDKRN
ncbi:MAG: NAD kinase [Bacteroidales bacterium]|nr:NAD kinase [Bacteroidales bacterium]